MNIKNHKSVIADVNGEIDFIKLRDKIRSGFRTANSFDKNFLRKAFLSGYWWRDYFMKEKSTCLGVVQTLNSDKETKKKYKKFKNHIEFREVKFDSLDKYSSLLKQWASDRGKGLSIKKLKTALDTFRKLEVLDAVEVYYLGKLAGVNFAVIFDDLFVDYLFGWDRENKRLSLGKQIIHYNIERSKQLKIPKYIIGSGTTTYKKRFGFVVHKFDKENGLDVIK